MPARLYQLIQQSGTSLQSPYWAAALVPESRFVGQPHPASCLGLHLLGSHLPELLLVHALPCSCKALPFWFTCLAQNGSNCREHQHPEHSAKSATTGCKSPHLHSHNCLGHDQSMRSWKHSGYSIPRQIYCTGKTSIQSTAYVQPCALWQHPWRLLLQEEMSELHWQQDKGDAAVTRVLSLRTLRDSVGLQ